MDQSRKAENEQKRRRWQKHLEDWAASGKTQVAYCREHELSRHQFQYWKKRLLPSDRPEFIELRFDTGNRRRHCPLRLMVGSNYEVAVERDFDPVALQQLLGALSAL